MSKRFTFGPIIPGGSGGINDSARAAVSDVPLTNSTSIIPLAAGPPPNLPRWLHTISAIATANLAGVLAVSNLYVFPDYPLDGRLDGMEPVTRAEMTQNLETYTLDAAGTHMSLASFVGAAGDAKSFREFVLFIVQFLDPGITNLTNFDAQEPTQ